MTTRSLGKLVLILGPSGVGKSVLLKMLRRNHPELVFPRSVTTRERRPKEGDELYHFVTEEKFDDYLAREKLLEWATVHGVGRYGTLLEEIIPPIRGGKIVVREVDVQGFDSIRSNALFTGTFAPHHLQSIFILPDSKQELIERITARAPISADELRRRVASMEKELDHAKHCDAAIRNPQGHLQETYRKLEEIVLRKPPALDRGGDGRRMPA